MESNHNKKPVRLNERVKQVGGTLIIKEARVEDSGKYLCMVNNSVGGESVETVLTVTGEQCVSTATSCLLSKNIHLAHLLLFYMYCIELLHRF